MPGEIKISPIGTMAGSLAATATYSSLVTISGTASTVVDISAEGGGYLLSKGIGKLFGSAAEIATGAICRVVGRTASSTIQNYSPALATAVAAVVGVTTSLIVSGGEYVIRGAVSKLHDKYYEQQEKLENKSEQLIILNDSSTEETTIT